MKIRRMVSGRLAQVAVAGALAAAGLAGTLATGPAAGASPVAGQAAATAPKWRTQATPEPAGTIDQSFDAVSCSSSSACLAIGSDVLPHHVGIILGEFAEIWNGSRWTVHQVPNGTGKVFLEAVKCRSARWCVAVGGIQGGSPPGSQVPVADTWNGRTWKQVRLPLPAGATSGTLAAVACSGTAACTAIGESANKSEVQSMLAERWNGSAWKVQPIPAPTGGGADLEGVACPTVHACRAVGFDNQGLLTEFWNGSSWAAQPAPVPAGTTLQYMSAISCTSAGSCEAVGGYESESNLDWYTLAEVWNGSRWRVQATPAVSGATSAALSAVSCVSATDCEAAGQVMTKGNSIAFGVLEKWNGTKWSIQEQLPAEHKPSRMEGVSCTTGPVCEAVGFRSQVTAGGTLLAQRYSSR
jgi:hypothetical protein